MINHVGILVEDFDDVAGLLTGHLGVEVGVPEVVDSLGLEILWVETGGVALEFIRPLRPDTRAAALLAEGVSGVHHLAFAVDDIDATLLGLKNAGVAVLDEVARAGVHGSRIAFIEPSEAGGTLIELVQPRDVRNAEEGKT